jgi:hypothetical protein
VLTPLKVSTGMSTMTEWGVARDHGVIPCESEQAARQLAAETGGELTRRRTYVMSWAELPAPEGQHREPAATPVSG